MFRWKIVTYLFIPSLSLFRKLNRVHRLGLVAALIATLIASVALDAMAQSTGKDRASEKQDVGVSERRPAGLPHGNGFSAGPLSSGPLMLLPAVDYDASGFQVQGTSAVLADVNGDGKADVIVTLPNSSSVGVLLGNGDGTFQTPKTYNAGLSNPSSVAVADVNGDGKPDLLVANLCGTTCANGSVAVLLGNGDGTFQAPAAYDSGGYFTTSIAAGDVNGDGKPDLVVTNWCPDSSCSANGTVGVLLGKGDGTFQPAVTYDVGARYAQSVAIADVNGDGKADVVVANWCPSASVCILDMEVAVLLGDGDGTFKPAVTYGSGGFGANAISVADVNGDGKLDLLVNNVCSSSACTTADTTVGVLLGNGNGTFQSAVAYDSGVQASGGLAVADVNGDGKLDLVVYGCRGDASCNNGFSFVGVLLGKGDGTFQPGLNYFADQSGSGSPAVGDLNGDGKPDVVVATACSSSSSSCTSGDAAVGVLLNNNGAPATTTSLASSMNPVTFRQTVTYTATVASQSGGTLGGTVTFADGAAPIATVTLLGNQATYSTSYNSFGSHPITASYSGVLHTAEGSRSTTLTENVVFSSKTVLTTSGSPSFVGQPVTFTANVTSNDGPIPDGELVKFYDGTTLLASVPLASEKATFTTSTLSARKHGMKATYVGDTKFATSTGLVTQVVELYSTTTTLTCSPNPSSFGQTVTMTATVKSAGPNVPTGKVTFYDGTTWIGAATLSGGVATITKSNLAVGTHSITAAYGGDSMSAKSTSPTVNQVVH